MHICRTRFGKEIVTEFIPAVNKRSQKVLIFCAGVPGAPYKDDVMEFWAQRGYWTFFPRYRGSWESEGEFLKYSLEQDVLEVVDGLTKKLTDYWTGDTYEFAPQSINIVGSSFGGPAALLASRDPRVNKVICVAPVVDWQAENKNEPLDELYKILRYAFGNAYQVNKTNWNKLARGNFYNPVRHIAELDGGKILIYHAEDDDIVKIQSVARFAKKTGARFVRLKKGGHISSAILMNYRYYWQARRFIESV